MRRRERIGKDTAVGDEPEMPEVARIAVAQKLLEKLPALHAMRRRTQHRDQVRTRLRGGEHLAPLAQIHRHAGLAKNVFARLERRDGDGRMQHGRRADPDDVEIGTVEHLGPVVHDLGNVKLLRDLLRRFDARIADRDDLHVGQREQARQMTLPDNAARAHDTDAQFLRRRMLRAHTNSSRFTFRPKKIIRRPAPQSALAIRHLANAARDLQRVHIANLRPDGKAHRCRCPVIGNAHRGEHMRRLDGADEARGPARNGEPREIEADEQILAVQSLEADVERVGKGAGPDRRCASRRPAKPAPARAAPSNEIGARPRRNRLAHGYETVDHRLVLQIVRQDLDGLRTAVEGLIAGDD